MTNSRTVLMTGGHVTPAVALGQALKRHDSSVRIVYLGRPLLSEQREVERIGMEFIPLASGKAHRYLTVSQLREIPKLVTGFLDAWRLLRRIRPQVVVGFGGYLSIPVALIATLLRIPVVIHEQTAAWGAANRLLKHVACASAVSWPHLVESGVVLTGNPIPDEIRAIKRKADGRPILLILGGSQGSRTIDEAVAPLLADLTKRFDVYHQTRGHPQLAVPTYRHAPWFPTPELAKILSRTSLVLSRAGANTVTYLAFLGIPAILVPLPIAGSREQQKNAQILEKTGLAVVIHQSVLTPAILKQAIDRHMSHGGRDDRKKTRAFVVPDAADRLAKLVVPLAYP